MKINIRQHIQILFLLTLLTSCTSYKKVAYLQETRKQYETDLPIEYRQKNVHFLPGDVLSITVNSGSEPAAAAAFNLPMQPSATSESLDEALNSGVGRQTYMVDENGTIDFPVLGKVSVQGKTRQDLEGELKKSLMAYIKEEPVITVRLINYKISVMGEVARPGQYQISRERINLLEALALAGDMTIYGKREDVAIIREMPDGTYRTARLDLTTSLSVESPYFYLCQNDVIYVEPNKTRSQSSGIGAQTSIWISLGSIALTLANMIILLTKK